MPLLIDSHCHLDFPDFAADLPQAIDRAQAAGVEVMISIGTSLRRIQSVREVAERFENVYYSVGVHPHEAGTEPLDDPALLTALVGHPKAVALGETGLDYHYDLSPREAQRRTFRSHIAAARTTGLPLTIHARNADDEISALLKEEMRAGAFSGVIHCFSSSRALAETALELGLYLSISGIVTFPKAEELRAIVRDIPLNRLLVETDAPYLAPAPNRGKRNEPAYTALTAKTIAEVKGVPYAAVAEATTSNALKLFKKISVPQRPSQDRATPGEASCA